MDMLMTPSNNKKNQESQEPTNPPEQRLGDTPVAPWQMPTPAEKQQAEPVRQALKQAVQKVDSQQKADEVIGHLESTTAGQKAVDVEQTQPQDATPADAAHKVEQAAKQAPGI